MTYFSPPVGKPKGTERGETPHSLVLPRCHDMAWRILREPSHLLMGSVTGSVRRRDGNVGRTTGHGQGGVLTQVGSPLEGSVQVSD